MTPEQYADKVWDNKKQIHALSESEKKILLETLYFGAEVGAAALNGTLDDSLLLKIVK